MHYIVLARDADGMAAMRAEHRQSHVDYWQGQGEALLVAGAMMSGDGDDAAAVGSSFLLAAADEAAARALIAGDPFSTLGIFSGEVTVQRVRPAIGTLWPA